MIDFYIGGIDRFDHNVLPKKWIAEFQKELAAQFEKVESQIAISKNANAILKAEVDNQRKEFTSSIIQI